MQRVAALEQRGGNQYPAIDRKAQQQEAQVGTQYLAEIDGRAYANLKLLTQVGRAYFNEQKNKKRAAEYQLKRLREPTQSRKPKSATKPNGSATP